MKHKNIIWVQRSFTIDRKYENKEGQTVYVFCMTDGSPDRHGTVLDSRWNFDNYMLNPIFLWMHHSFSKDPDTAIGSTLQIEQDGERFLSYVTFEEASINPLAEKLRLKVEAGTLRAVSVGFNPTGGGCMGDKTKGQNPELYYYGERDLLEHSLVKIGSNPMAVIDGEQMENAKAIRMLNNYRGNEKEQVKVKGLGDILLTGLRLRK